MSAVVEAETPGDPCRNRKWIRQSLRQLKAKLAGVGVILSHTSIARLLKQQHYSLKAIELRSAKGVRKAIATTQHPQRDLQFRYIRRIQQRFIRAGHPVISVDTKKKELMGNFKNAGRSWRRTADLVNDHEFLQNGIAKAVLYGIYDVVYNQGYV